MDQAIDVTVVAPVPWVPPGLARFTKGLTRWRDVPSESRLDDRIQVYYPRMVLAPRYMLYAMSGLSLYYSVSKLLRTERGARPYDLIHAHMLVPDGFGANLLARSMRIPCVSTSLGYDANLYPAKISGYKWAAAWTIRQSARLSAVSQALCEKLDSIELCRNKLHYIPLGVDCDMFQPMPEKRQAFRTARSVPPRAFVLVYVGWIHRNKGLFELIEAFANLAHDFPKALLVLVGKGPDHESLAGRAVQLGVESRVRFTDYVEDAEVPRWMALSDALVLPSHSEGLPNVLLEAMSTSLPVLASNVGGIPELLRNGELGLLCRAGDTQDLTQQMLRLFSMSDQERLQLGLRARKHVQQNYSWRRNAELTIEMYTHALRGTPSRD